MIKARIRELQAQREALEMEADAIVSYLTAPGPNGEKPIGVKDSLVDREGFPRNDIDIYQARIRRGRLAVISNDHKLIMKEIESELPKLHATFDKPVFGQVEAQVKEVKKHVEITSNIDDYRSYRAIALIDEVLEHSPAQLSGLQVGDKIICFGSVNALSSPNPLSLVPEVVKDFHTNRNNSPVTHIPLVILRGKDEYIRIQLIPQIWYGRGLLGCHLKPV